MRRYCPFARTNWQLGNIFKKYFEMPAFFRPTGLFFNFCFDFNHEAWFAGGDFGLTVMLKAPFIWNRILSWRKEKEVLWEEWAKRVIKECALTWTAENQSFSERSMIWGLKSCFVDTLGYLGVVEQIKKEGKYGPELHAVRLTPWGQVCLKQLEEMLTKRPSQQSDFFSLS